MVCAGAGVAGKAWGVEGCGVVVDCCWRGSELHGDGCGGVEFVKGFGLDGVLFGGLDGLGVLHDGLRVELGSVVLAGLHVRNARIRIGCCCCCRARGRFRGSHFFPIPKLGDVVQTGQWPRERECTTFGQRSEQMQTEIPHFKLQFQNQQFRTDRAPKHY